MEPSGNGQLQRRGGADEAPGGGDEVFSPPAPRTEAELARAKEVRQLIEEGQKAATPEERMKLFERAHRRDLNDPMAMSYHGMAIAEVQHHYQQGIVFCEEAVRRMGPHPDLLVNLAKAFLAAKNKREAVRCLRRALARSRGADERARVELAHLGLRRPPVLPFLPRSFFLNKYLGILRHRLLTRKLPNDNGATPIPAELGQLSGDLAAARRQLSLPAEGSPDADTDVTEPRAQERKAV